MITTRQRLLIATALGAGVLAATLATTAEFATAQPASAHPGSSSTGVEGTGIDSGGANDGSYSGQSGSYSATGIHTSHGRGYADASVSNLSIGGRSLGSVTVTCRQGVTHVSHSGGIGSSSTLHVSYGSGGGPSATGMVATITDTRGRVAQTIRAASVSCEHLASVPTRQPIPSAHPKRHVTDRSHDGGSDDRVAPAPVPEPGHVSVTG